MAPDLDLAVPFVANFPPKSLSFYGLLDKRLVNVWHRTYTHSLFYTALASLALAFAAKRFSGGRGRWWRWAILIWLAVVSHVVLDATNIWDVHPWPPFSDESVAWLLMPLLDSVFTGLLGLAFLINHYFRDSYAAGDPRPLRPAWRERSSAALNRLIGSAPLAWIVAILLVLRVMLTVWGVFTLPTVHF